MKTNVKIDMVGKTFGKLTVIQEANMSHSGRTQWLCRCSCPAQTEKIFIGKYLRNGDTKSCGCMKVEAAKRIAPIPQKRDPKPIKPKIINGRSETRIRKTRDQQLKRNYGISIEDYEQMLIDQNNICPVCKEILVDRICVDHDHKTAKVRAILHNNCNVLLGAANDNIKILEGAITYLYTHKELATPDVLSNLILY